MGEPLGYDDFVNAMENLLKILSLGDRNTLLTKNKEVYEQNTNYNNKSTSSNGEVFDRLMRSKQVSQNKLQEKRERKRAEELAGCTFKPTINEYRKDTRHNINLQESCIGPVKAYQLFYNIPRC